MDAFPAQSPLINSPCDPAAEHPSAKPPTHPSVQAANNAAILQAFLRFTPQTRPFLSVAGLQCSCLAVDKVENLLTVETEQEQPALTALGKHTLGRDGKHIYELSLLSNEFDLEMW